MFLGVYFMSICTCSWSSKVSPLTPARIKFLATSAPRPPNPARSTRDPRSLEKANQHANWIPCWWNQMWCCAMWVVLCVMNQLFEMSTLFEVQASFKKKKLCNRVAHINVERQVQIHKRSIKENYSYKHFYDWTISDWNQMTVLYCVITVRHQYFYRKLAFQMQDFFLNWGIYTV